MINDNTMHIKPKDIFDSCIVGYHLVYQSWLYDYELLIDGFIQLGLTYEEAMDHVSYNIIPCNISLCTRGRLTPLRIIVTVVRLLHVKKVSENQYFIRFCVHLQLQNNEGPRCSSTT